MGYCYCIKAYNSAVKSRVTAVEYCIHKPEGKSPPAKPLIPCSDPEVLPDPVVQKNRDGSSLNPVLYESHLRARLPGRPACLINKGLIIDDDAFAQMFRRGSR